MTTQVWDGDEFVDVPDAVPAPDSGGGGGGDAFPVHPTFGANFAVAPTESVPIGLLAHGETAYVAVDDAGTSMVSQAGVANIQSDGNAAVRSINGNVNLTSDAGNLNLSAGAGDILFSDVSGNTYTLADLLAGGIIDLTNYNGGLGLHGSGAAVVEGAASVELLGPISSLILDGTGAVISPDLLLTAPGLVIDGGATGDINIQANGSAQAIQMTDAGLNLIGTVKLGGTVIGSLYEAAGAAAGAVSTHAAAGDPHPGYLTPAEGNAAYEASGAVAAHAAAGDPHAVYLTATEGNAAYDAVGAAAAAAAASIAKTLVDAKGDLLVATANDTPARLAVGSNDQVLVADSAQATGLKWAAPAGGAPDIQAFTANGTWNKPAGKTMAFVTLIGGGGGGGSGCRSTAGTARVGGGGGGGAVIADAFFPISGLGSTEAVTVGAGGAGGAAITVDSTGGSNGASGGISSFGTWLSTSSAASGGTGGGFGAGGSGGGNATGMYGSSSGGGASGTSGATGNTGGLTNTANATGGGAGGGIGTGNGSNAGGDGGISNAFGAKVGGAGGSAAAGAGGAGVSTGAYTAGLGGGGGGTRSTVGTAGGAGGNGVNGSGGGGGGASVNGFDSGKGGNGGNGVVVVVSW